MSMRVFVALAGGLVASLWWPWPPSSLWLWAGLLALVPLCWPGRACGARRLGAMILCGLLLGLWQGQRLLDALWPAERDDQAVRWQGCVDDFPVRLDYAGRPLLRLSVRVTALQAPGLPADALRGARLRLTAAADAEPPEPGQCFAFAGSLRRPRALSSPGAMPHDAWLLGHDVVATGRVLRMSALPAQRLPLPRRWLVDLRRAWVAHIHRLEPDARRARLLRALVAGDQGALSAADWEVLQATGTTHLFVVSGLHIGLAASAGFWLGWLLGIALSWLRLPVTPWRTALLVSLLVAWSYCLLSGAGVPARRAAVMLSLTLLCHASGRFRGLQSGLYLSAMLIVAMNPWAVFLPGFWLSFAAVACLWLSLVLVQARRSASRMLLQAQWGIGVGLAPLLLAFGKPLALAGWLFNLVLVPLLGMAVAALLLLLLLCWFWSAPAPLLAWLSAGLGTVWQLLDSLHQAGFSAARALPRPPHALALLLALLAAALLLLPLGWRVRGLALLLLLPWLYPRPQLPAAGGLAIHVLEVGQGQAVLLQTRRHSLLYDAGPASPAGWNAASAVIAPFMDRQGLRRLDRIMVSHADLDHAGGLPWLRQRFPDAAVWHSGLPLATGPACRRGQHWHWDGVDFLVLHPPAAAYPASSNDASCVLRVALPGFVGLLPGDIERAAEYRLVMADAETLKADWLLAAHHGSRTSSSWPWVKAVAPAQVVISAGYRSRFGHPHPEVRERWQAIGAEVLQTDSCGSYSLQVAADGSRRWRCHRQGYRPYWRRP